MGNQQDIMNEFALQDLKRIYSSFDGWKMSSRKPGSGYDTLVRLERLNGGHHDIVKVLVTFNKEIPANLVAELSKKDTMSDGMVTRCDSAVIAPLNADTSALPAGMKVYSMSSFGFEGNELIWTKKKVSRVPIPLAVKKAA